MPSNQYFTPYGLMTEPPINVNAQIEVNRECGASYPLYTAQTNAPLKAVSVSIYNLAEDEVYSSTNRKDVVITPDSQGYDTHVLQVPDGTLPITPCRWYVSVAGSPDIVVISGRNTR